MFLLVFWGQALLYFLYKIPCKNQLQCVLKTREMYFDRPPMSISQPTLESEFRNVVVVNHTPNLDYE